MKIFFGVLLLLLSVIIGYLSASKLTKRVDFFITLDNLHKKLVSEINFSQKSLPIIIDEIDNRELKDYALNFLNKTESSKSIDFLSSEEQSFTQTYLNNLGLSDKKTQLIYLNSVECQISDYKKKAINDRDKFKPLFIKMGFLIGLILFIVVL